MMRSLFLNLLIILLFFGSCNTKTKTVGSCGDGFLDPGEACDGSQMSATTCTELGYYEQTDTLTCRSDCTFDLTVCTGGRCGDGIIQAGDGEDCDGENLAGLTCDGLQLGGGILRCLDTCRWDLTGCELAARCGDGVVQPIAGEECEGADLDGATCVTLGYSQGSGSLGCSAGCEFDESACVPMSTNADLSSLTVSSGTLTPPFSAGTTSYSVMVPMEVTTLTVTATQADALASLEINPSQPMTLAMGGNPATVTVTAESGAQKVYSVVITRQTPADYESANIGTLKYVPAGTFQRDAMSTNLSTVSAFWMSQHEITRAQWTSVTQWADPSNVSYSSGAGDPVQMVNWYAAMAFCNKLSLREGLTPVYSVSGVNFTTLTYGQVPAGVDPTWDAVTVNWSANGYRLPTEMEWMWAAMGADSASPGATNTTGYLKAFSGSTGSNDIGDYVVFGYATSEIGATTTERSDPVGSKISNELGLYDMSGNVYEWIWDWYATVPAGSLTDYRGALPGSVRVGRGGAWSSGSNTCLMTYRKDYSPTSSFSSFGFRVVRY